MIKRLFGILVLSLSIGYWSYAGASTIYNKCYDYSCNYDVLYKSTALIVKLHGMERVNGQLQFRYSTGSGTYIDSNYVLTAAHVIAGKGISIQVFNNYYFDNAKVIYFNRDLDIAVLRVSKPLPYHLDIENSKDYSIGSKILSLAAPLQLGNTFGVGYITGKRYNGSTLLHQTDMPLTFGASGGAIVNEDNNIIGVINSIDTRTSNIGYYIPSELWMSDVLRAIRKDKVRE